MHGQPVVFVGIHEALRSKSVDLDRTVEELEFLCAQDSPDNAETD
jgi:hypothetical protein